MCAVYIENIHLKLSLLLLLLLVLHIDVIAAGAAGSDWLTWFMGFLLSCLLAAFSMFYKNRSDTLI